MNECGACRQDFSSVELFDRHRVGVHAYTFWEGLRMDIAVEDGRRCLDEDEMQEKGWRRNSLGRWFDPVRASRAERMRIPSAQAQGG